MMRMFKYYHLNVNDPATASTSVSFSGYPGLSFAYVTSQLTYWFTWQRVATSFERVYVQLRLPAAEASHGDCAS